MQANTLPKISVITPYCTNDYQFLRINVEKLLEFTNSIFFVYSDYYWNGEPENLKLIRKSIKENPEVNFIKVSYVNKAPPIPSFICKLIPKRCLFRPLYGRGYQEGMVRWKGYQKAKADNPDYFFFLDADEIVDSIRFIEWLKYGLDRKLTAMIFGSYEYFRSPKYQANNWEMKGVMVKNRNFNKEDFFTHWFRERLYQTSPNPKSKNILGLDGLPMVHHYGWAKTKEQLLKKTRTWSHSLERNWKKAIEKEFSREFDGYDTIFKKNYKIVKPFI